MNRNTIIRVLFVLTVVVLLAHPPASQAKSMTAASLSHNSMVCYMYPDCEPLGADCELGSQDCLATCEANGGSGSQCTGFYCCPAIGNGCC
jgi:hypothetical protein